VPSETQLPPLTTLRIFEAAARHQSFLLAAGELNITPGAVSKQVKQLELSLGQPLFERNHRQVRLTKAGQIFFKGISQAFEDIRAVTKAVAIRPDGERLVLWCAPWFLRAWLLPRLERFRSSSPKIQLDVLTGDSSDAISPRADIAIRLGSGDWPRVKSEMLISQEITAVCTPRYLKREKIGAPYSFSDFVVLDSANTPDHLHLWKEAAGFQQVDPKERIVFLSSESAFAAAQSDHGIALVHPRFIEKELATGDLVRPWGITTRTNKHYYLTRNENFRLPPAAAAFRKWLLDEFKRT